MAEIRRASVLGASAVAAPRYACRAAGSAASGASPRALRNRARSRRSLRYAANVSWAAPRSAASISRNASRCFQVAVASGAESARRLFREARIWQDLFDRSGGRRRVPQRQENTTAEQHQGDHEDECNSELPHAPTRIPVVAGRIASEAIDDRAAGYASTLPGRGEKERQWPRGCGADRDSGGGAARSDSTRICAAPNRCPRRADGGRKVQDRPTARSTSQPSILRFR